MMGIQEILDKAIQDAVEKGGVDAERIEELLPKIIADTLPGIADTLLKSLRNSAPEMLAERRGDLEDFRERLFERYRKAFDLLEMYVVICEEVGSSFNTENRPTAAQNKDYKFEALTAIHARSLLIAQEVIWLLKGGYADGALGKWRTLHELAVTAMFISKEDPQIALRYLEHFRVHSHKATKQYFEYQKRANLEPMPEKALVDSRAQYEAALATYGKEFGEDFGWAYPVFKHPNIKLAQLEKHVGLDHWRPRYRWASHYTHPNYKPIGKLLGTNESGPPVLLVGPSNIGLTDPAHMTAISLMQATTAQLNHIPTVDQLVVQHILLTLDQEIGDAFLEAEREIMKDDAALRAASTPDDMNAQKFLRPAAFERIFSNVLKFFIRAGIVRGHFYVLEVRGRKSGKAISLPVDPIEVGGVHFLVCARGESNWVRNVRAAGEVTLIQAFRRYRFSTSEISPDQRPPVLKAYLDAFASEVQRFFPVAKGSAVEAFNELAAGYPVFHLQALD